ncbi:MAG: PSD1 and planctomycete cytochrome C domain-containing protein [Verrucomicrobiales bacterium]|nr:PSD1 and planctomycete cytochrome C domain-containing protein [Verrucomicrobiales bacterium]
MNRSSLAPLSNAVRRGMLFVGLLLLSKASIAEEIPPEHLDYFETHVRPALVKYCYECHSVAEGESKGGLYLDTREAMREGGSTGPLFDDENWEYSLFVDAVTWNDPDFEMPPKNKMPQDVIDKLVRWVEMGAPDPRERKIHVVETGVDIEAGKDHWAYQSPVGSAQQNIDDLVSAKREADGTEPVGEADALSLLRRLTFDLTGLPPTPPEIKAFHAAEKKDREVAIREKVEQLLDSPQYGERWGRHWLDVVRFGESAGTHNMSYPYAWRFRNYVIDSFNEDKPFDRLITEHLAGDLLPARSDEEKQELLIATGFLAIGPKIQNGKNRQVFAMNLIDEQIDTTTRGFMATTVSCARCHDHKFDPISTADYYAMAGIFKSTETLWGTIAGNQNHRASDLLELPIPDTGLSTEDQREEYEEKKALLAELIERNNYLRGRSGGKGKGKGGGGRADPEERAAMLEKEGMEQRDLIRLKQQILRTESALKFLNPDGSAKTFAMGVREGDVANTNILVTGDVTKPAQEVERGLPEVLQFKGTPEVPSSESGRLQLAEWITSKENPLTARVMVNRIWMHLTGTPIVETMDNFGTTGLPPSNQELLDHLAIRFMAGGWSIKNLVREIVLTDTYQLASTFHSENYAKDPANTTHWRANVRQLDAESLRDQMLLVSGLLDRTRPETSMVHEAGDVRISDDGRGTDVVANMNLSSFRGRSLYLPVMRDALPDSMGLFDFPDPQGTIGKRQPTNVAPQSLHLMNSELVQIQSRAMAEVLSRNFSSVRDQVSNAFLLAYSRPATNDEVSSGLQFLQSFDPGEPSVTEPQPTAAPEGRSKGKGKGGKGKGKGRAATPDAAPASQKEPMTTEETKLAAFCQALMMSAEFRTIH